ncbi:hypothetical protein JDN40_00405, partial [Rhodomicrobium vannielii ATCC 17100]|uniref:hypothetical protein n=1 Tax=Rhodomicrobium vannielii TaxID=1069 RepID=UPI001918CE1E
FQFVFEIAIHVASAAKAQRVDLKTLEEVAPQTVPTDLSDRQAAVLQTLRAHMDKNRFVESKRQKRKQIGVVA